tara:strand:+ start:2037 stop:2888 length:852 start_codon:yes stop_codon:yes gene_type:complete
MNENHIIDSFAIRWVVALKEEAKIIIDHYKLSIIDGNSLYPVFKNFDETHWLVLSGIGRHNAAAATAYLYSISEASKSTAWVNLGIAGCGKGDYGDLCLVDKISNSYGKNRYPTIMPRSVLAKMHLFTSDTPINNYSSQELIDMEGSAFYDIVSKFTSNELICLMKVISDGPENDLKDLNRSKIIDLIKSNIMNIKKIISYYEKLSHYDFLRNKKPYLFSQITSKWHFSVTQKYQLENLLRRVRSFLSDNNVWEIIKDCKKGASVLDILEFKIKKSEVDWSSS